MDKNELLAILKDWNEWQAPLADIGIIRLEYLNRLEGLPEGSNQICKPMLIPSRSSMVILRMFTCSSLLSVFHSRSRSRRKARGRSIQSIPVYVMRSDSGFPGISEDWRRISFFWP